MFGFGIAVLNRRAKLHIWLFKMLNVRQILPSLRLVEQTSWIILTGLENFIEFVQACVQLPKKAVLACWNFQKRLFLLPFVCLHKIYCKFVGIAKPFLPKIIIERATPSQILTGQRNPSPERIIEACKEIRTSAIKSISTKSFRYQQPQSHVSDYRHQLDKWRIESEKRTEELYKIGKEDKELMKAVASGLRHLKVLKSRRDLMHSYYNKNISTMINDGTATGEKLLSMKNSIKVADAAILEKRNTCLDMLNRCQLDDVSDSGYTSPVKTDPFQSLDEDLNPPAENMQKVLSIVTEENSLLRSQLTNTVKNLEDILKVSMNINNEVVLLNEKLSKMNNFNEELSDLQYKLDEERELLLSVQADRDIMKEKLNKLLILIKEEEEFLGDSKLESGYEEYELSSLATDLDLDFSLSSH